MFITGIVWPFQDSFASCYALLALEHQPVDFSSLTPFGSPSVFEPVPIQTMV
jgi:hypothetical protein